MRERFPKWKNEVWIFMVSFGMIYSVQSFAADAEAKFYDPQNRRDPFVALVATGMRANSGTLAGVEAADDLILEGIAYDPKGSIVMANGSVLKEGETVGNVKVVRVEPSQVIFEVSGVEVVKEVYANKGAQ